MRASSPFPSASMPSLYFIGVSTGSSSIRQVFPRWAKELGLDAELVGIDLPLHAPAEQFQDVVRFLASDPLSLGALVTTHKVDLFAACSDLFDVVDPLAQMMGEVSCISKRGDELVCHAKDPTSSGLAIDALLPRDYWSEHDTDAFLMGAGGSNIAIAWNLTHERNGGNRPKRLVVSNRSPGRIEHFQQVYAKMDTSVDLDLVLADSPRVNDEVLASCRAGALVVNGTGLGKDAPGSPLTNSASFPDAAITWDLNYRGNLVFLEQARAQEGERHLRVEDGWIYFLHGWTQVIAEVFHIEIPTSGPHFDRLAELAEDSRVSS